MQTSEKIRQLRQKRKWSSNAVAKRIGVAPTTYRRWEQGGKIPTEALIKVASLYGVSLSELIVDDSEQSERIRKAIYYIEEGLDLIKGLRI